ncbi:MAG: hypothetical protein ACPHK8_02920 [Thermoplasmatota archaeon]
MRREPVMRRIRADRRATSPLRDPLQRSILMAGLALLIALASLPFTQVQWSLPAERIATIASLFFLVAAGGQVFGLKGRSFIIAFFVVGALYGLTSLGQFVFEFEDFFVIAVLVSFLIFVMAGFYLTLLLEDGIAWVQDRVSPEEPQGSLVVFLLATILMGTLPALGAFWIWFKWLWVTSLIGVVILGAWWAVHVKRNLHPDPVMRDLDLLVAGTLAAVGLAEVVSRIREESHFVPSVLAYVALLGTWLYLSYVTVRRTQALLKHNDPGPWLSILFAAAFSIIAHAERRFRIDVDYATDSLLGLRVAYLLAGIWIGIAFFAIRASWTTLQHVRDTAKLGTKGRKLARAAARVTEELLEAEQRIDDAAESFFTGLDRGMDKVIGRRKTKEKRRKMR